MANKLKLTLVALSVLIGMVTTFVYVTARRQFQRQTAVTALIRDMDGIDQQLSQASFEFGLALTQFLKSAEEADLSAVQQSHQTLVASVNHAIAMVSHAQSPASEHGGEFVSAQRRFLLVQRRIYREDFGRLLKLLEDTSRPLPQRANSIQAIIDAAFAETQQEFASVHAAREQLANEFAIQLTAR